MPLPFVLPAIETALSIIPEIGKLGLASRQKKQADELAKIKRPEFEIPSAATEALQRARFRALNTKLPGQALMEQQIGQATAQGQRYATETAASPVDALATASAITGNQQNALGNLAIEGANMFDRNQAALTNQLGSYATWQNQKNAWDKYQPYTEAKQAESALRYGAEANKYSGWKGILGAAAGGALMADNRGLFDSAGRGGNYSPPNYNGSDTSNIFNPASTTAPQNYPFENAFPTSIPASPNNMGGGNMRDIVAQRFMQRYGRMPSAQELAQLGY